MGVAMPTRYGRSLSFGADRSLHEGRSLPLRAGLFSPRRRSAPSSEPIVLSTKGDRSLFEQDCSLHGGGALPLRSRSFSPRRAIAPSSSRIVLTTEEERSPFGEDLSFLGSAYRLRLKLKEWMSRGFDA
jgi:hypothetical protein